MAFVREKRGLRPLEVARALVARADPPAWLTFGASAGFVALVAFGVRRHEPWFDEAQAWLLARDLSFWDLQAHHLRYEGTPGLWHALLFGATRLGAPPAALNAIGAAAAAVGALLLLWRSPFPAAVRLVLPFTYFLAYQYAVVARSYNLIAAALFATALAWPSRERRPFLFAASLVLLSHTSLHGFLIAGGVAAAHALGLLARRSSREHPLRRMEAAALLLVAANAVVIVRQLLPPADLAFATRTHFGLDRFATTGSATLDDAIAGIPILSEAALAVSAIWMWRRRTLSVFLFPLVAILALGAWRYQNVWHQGIVWLLWIFALWIAFDPSNDARDRTREKTRASWRLAVALFVLAACAFQLVWSARAYAYDAARPYSASRALAEKLAAIGCPSCRVQLDGFKPVAANLYFDRNIFANLNGGGPRGFWFWSTSNPLLARRHESVFDNDPDYVVLSSFSDRISVPPGYRLETIFPGGIFWKTGVKEPDRYALLRRTQPETPAGR